ncbi:hypothetical protein [Aquibium microcysteis]|uniref:hypothetical protein n=1 Tax=Aquibium microcysteis TaxID=675281 RepID=UPI001AED5817|nr:hypothetical protein [Aquibium microcysteis]
MKRLQREHPVIFADLKAGNYRSDREALIAAGLRKASSRLQDMKNAWAKATDKERMDFINWIKRSGRVSVASSAPATSTPIVDADHRLSPASSARITNIIKKRGITPGDMMREMGLPSLDQSVARALRNGYKLRADVVNELTKWIQANRSHW